MKSSTRPILPIFLLLSFTFGLQAFALMAPPRSLEERVNGADKIFVYKVVSLKMEEGFFTAMLNVEEALHGTEKGEQVKVLWTVFISNQGFNPQVGDTGIAIVSDKHNGAYWFRKDKVEPLAKQEEIVKLLAKE